MKSGLFQIMFHETCDYISKYLLKSLLMSNKSYAEKEVHTVGLQEEGSLESCEVDRQRPVFLVTTHWYNVDAQCQTALLDAVCVAEVSILLYDLWPCAVVPLCEVT